MVRGKIRISFIAACAAVLICASSAYAATRAELSGVIDFSVTMRRVAEAAEGRAALPPGKFFILVGTVTEVTPLSKEEGDFSVRVRLLAGEWFGNTEVKGYSCYVTFTGSAFKALFPARVSADSPADAIAVNTRVLTVARWTGTTLSPTGEKIAQLEGVEVRAIQ